MGSSVRQAEFRCSAAKLFQKTRTTPQASVKLIPGSAATKSHGVPGVHRNGTAFRVARRHHPIAERSARNTAPCATTSTAGGSATARLIAATARSRSAAKVSAPSGVHPRRSSRLEPVRSSAGPPARRTPPRAARRRAAPAAPTPRRRSPPSRAPAPAARRRSWRSPAPAAAPPPPAPAPAQFVQRNIDVALREALARSSRSRHGADTRTHGSVSSGAIRPQAALPPSAPAAPPAAPACADNARRSSPAASIFSRAWPPRTPHRTPPQSAIENAPATYSLPASALSSSARALLEDLPPARLHRVLVRRVRREVRRPEHPRRNPACGSSQPRNPSPPARAPVLRRRPAAASRPDWCAPARYAIAGNSVSTEPSSRTSVGTFDFGLTAVNSGLNCSPSRRLTA